jgi:endonuclease III
MKDSKIYSGRVQKQFRSWARSYPKVQKVTCKEPIDALIYGIICEKLTEANSQAAIKRFREYFVDWNDLRVSRPEEIIEMLGGDSSSVREVASSLTTVLMKVFNKYNKITLEGLKKIGKKAAKQILENFEGCSPFVVDYCMLTALKGHAIPLTQQMIDYLRREELVDPGSDADQIEGFLTRHISAKRGYEFYALLRKVSEGTRKGKKKTTKKKITKKKATKRKTAKKKATKKKTAKKKATKKKPKTKKKTQKRK